MRLRAILPFLALDDLRFLTAAAPQRSLPTDTIVRPEDGFLYEADRLREGSTLLQSPEPFHFGPLGNVAVIEQTDGFVLVDAGGSLE